MAALTAAVVAVGILCLLDLLLTFGVIRRLREHEQLLNRRGMPDLQLTDLAPGEQVATFSAVTADGNPITGPSGLRVAGFFSSSCSACPEKVEPFIDYLAAHQVAPDEALSMLAGPPGDRPSYADRLAQVSRICVEQDGDASGEVSKAFKVNGFPVFFLLDSAQAVVGTSHDPAELPKPVR